jgi:lipoprotein NlpD
MAGVLKLKRTLALPMAPRWLIVIGLAVVLGGCASRGSPVVSDHSPVFGAMPASYQVQPGDTLYSIAWRYGLDVVELARINKVGKTFTIYPKQRLLLRRVPSPQRPTQAKPQSSPAAVPSKPSTATVKVGVTQWTWPVKFTPLLGYGERGSSGISRGVYYELPNGTRLRAAANGKVVYAGPGLGGYERLIILEHGQALLSAYGFHGKARVQEQQRIKAGTELADTMDSSAKFSRFHFEVRKHGRPVDPKRLILR